MDTKESFNWSEWNHPDEEKKNMHTKEDYIKEMQTMLEEQLEEQIENVDIAIGAHEETLAQLEMRMEDLRSYENPSFLESLKNMSFEEVKKQYIHVSCNLDDDY